jgi:hypothetical protein
MEVWISDACVGWSQCTMAPADRTLQFVQLPSHFTVPALVLAFSTVPLFFLGQSEGKVFISKSQ